MVNIVIVSHGAFGDALLGAVEMIAGPQEGVFTVSIAPGDSPDALSQALEAVLRIIEPAPALILIDLLGGTPYNVAARHALRHDVACVTGVNLPMVLEAILCRDELSLAQVAARITCAGRESVKDVGPLLLQRQQRADG